MSIGHNRELTNRLMLLWLINDASKRCSVGVTKVHKLTYLSQYEMIKQQEKGFSYEFIKLPMGPFSDEVKEDINWLKIYDLVTYHRNVDNRYFKLSKFGLKILSDFTELFTRNEVFTQKIADINHSYAGYTAQHLVDIVHKQPNPCCPSITIDDTMQQEPILKPLMGNAKQEFVITNEETETLEIYLDAESYESAIESCRSAQTKPLLSLNEVF
jgi:uncharacterized phage-associated protein